ncbi:endonuclease/exonuclease/phosphatase family protein [Nocardia veterana]|uniref:Endonuclease n=1 Tax=Nocardia veterana TaxID=132249 RepID=A0A7X6RIW2_9NOCA|nr:endonuclease/exonuclease/phosphatase family protein [Nocardia veterana]NKY87545.1 endonuclease [Nocardia veterana]
MTGTATRPVRVLTWNVQHANTLRARKQVSWLSRVDADVVVLTEVSAGAAGEVTAQWLREAGYAVHLPQPGADRYRVLVAAKGITDPVETAIAVMPHRFVTVRVKPATGALFTVAGIYVPSRGPKHERNVAKRAFQDAVSAALLALTEQCTPVGPCVIAGDLNVVEPDHVPHHRVYGAWEYDFYRSFAANGFIDAFRLLHAERTEHSWFGRVGADGERNGYRFDHLFIDSDHRHLVRECAYQHRPRLNGLSDHSAMTLTLHI